MSYAIYALGAMLFVIVVYRVAAMVNQRRIHATFPKWFQAISFPVTLALATLMTIDAISLKDTMHIVGAILLPFLLCHVIAMMYQRRQAPILPVWFNVIRRVGTVVFIPLLLIDFVIDFVKTL